MISNRQASVFDTPFLRAPTAVRAIETPIDATNTNSAVAVGTPMESGTYVGSQLIALTSAQGATIRYTTNGSMPNASSLVYTKPLVVSTASTIKAVALSGNTSSSVATRTYAINPRVLLPYAVAISAARGWQLARFAPQNNDFTYSVDVVPSLAAGFGPDGIDNGGGGDDVGTDAVIGLAWQQDDISSWNSINAFAYRNLLCRIRFSLTGLGRIEAYYGNRTGSGTYLNHGTNPDIRYYPTSTYTIVFSVQYAAQTFGVTVAVDGGAPQVLAVGYPWNANPPAFAGYVPGPGTTYIPTFASFNTLAMYSFRGGVQVRNNRLLSGVDVSPLLPQTIGWQAPVLAENAPDNIVSTEGTLVTAKRFGDSNPVTVNGVIFQGNILSNGIGTPAANYPAFASPGTASAALRDLYDSVVYDTSATHSISGLTIGTTYMLQWFFAEERTDYAARTQTVTIAGYTINLAAPLKAAATKCYFVATATSHDITIGMGTTLPQIMAFQVRQISGLAVAASLSASPTSITSGSSTTLAWSTGNATATSISQGVISFSGSDLYTNTSTQLAVANLYQPTVSSSKVPTGIFAAVPAATAATFATANLYITSTTPISNFIQFASGGIAYSFNLAKSEVIYQNPGNADNMVLKWTGSISANSGPLTTPTPAICIINGGGSGAWVASLTAGPVGPFSIAGAPLGENSSIGSSIITVPIAGGSIAVAPVATTTYSILAVGENDTSTTASATVTVVAAPAAIVTQPASQTIVSGTTSTLTVSATGSGPLSYQWYQGTSGTTTTSVGTNSAIFTTPSLTSTTSYWVRVSNSAGDVNSAAVTVTVTQPVPVIVNPPETTADVAIPFSYQIDATNSPTGYSVTGALPGGLTLNTFTGLISGTPTDVGVYSITLSATNTGGSGQRTISLTIAGGWRASVLAQNATDAIVENGEGTLVTAKRFGTTTNLTLNGVSFTGFLRSDGSQYNETTSALFSATGSATTELQSLYRSWTYYLTNGIHIITGLAIGETYMLQWFLGDERLSEAGRGQKVTIGGHSKIFPAPLTAKATKCYFVATNTSMDILIESSETAGMVGVMAAYQIRRISGVAAPVTPTIATAPIASTINSGDTATLTVAANGGGTLTYAWYSGARSNTSTPVGTNSASFTTPSLTSTTSYWVRVSNSAGSVDSNTATVTVTSPVLVISSAGTVTGTVGTPFNYQIVASNNPTSYAIS